MESELNMLAPPLLRAASESQLEGVFTFSPSQAPKLRITCGWFEYVHRYEFALPTQALKVDSESAKCSSFTESRVRRKWCRAGGAVKHIFYFWWRLMNDLWVWWMYLPQLSICIRRSAITINKVSFDTFVRSCDVWLWDKHQSSLPSLTPLSRGSQAITAGERPFRAAALRFADITY